VSLLPREYNARYADLLALDLETLLFFVDAVNFQRAAGLASGALRFQKPIAPASRFSAVTYRQQCRTDCEYHCQSIHMLFLRSRLWHFRGSLPTLLLILLCLRACHETRKIGREASTTTPSLACRTDGEGFAHFGTRTEGGAAR
jgi:hypothetical protein